MDEQTFTQSVNPNGRRSSMRPHRDALLRLSDAGYSGVQLAAFLAANGVNVTVGNVQTYVRRQRLLIAQGVAQSPPAAQPGQPSPQAQPVDRAPAPAEGRGVLPPKPMTLEEAIRHQPDLEALAKVARQARRARGSAL